MQESLGQRGRIIHAAMKVFAQSPCKKTSTADIAALAGILKCLLFYHYKNKKAVLLFVQVQLQKVSPKLYRPLTAFCQLMVIHILVYYFNNLLQA